MRIRANHIITPLLLAGTAALAVAAAPSASAGPSESTCSDMGGSTQCQRTGNVEIYAKPQDLPVTPATVYGLFGGYHSGHN